MNKICHLCGGIMKPCITTVSFKSLGKEIDGIECYTCIDCGERVFSSQEVKRIESVKNIFAKEVDKEEKADV